MLRDLSRSVYNYIDINYKIKLNITENTAEEAIQKSTNKMEYHEEQNIHDDVARITTGLNSEKKARKSFEHKTEGFIQKRSKAQQNEINKLRSIIMEMKNTSRLQLDKMNNLSEANNKMNNTIDQQRDKINQLLEENSEMKNTTGQQRDEINKLSEENIEIKNTNGQQRDKMKQLSEENIEMKASLILQQDTIDSLNAIVSDMSSTIEWMKKSIPSTIFTFQKH